MKKSLLLLICIFTIGIFAFAGNENLPTAIKSPSVNVAKSSIAFCTYTVNFHLSCGDFIGACYTCQGCSSEQINYDLNYYWGQYQNQYCGDGPQGLNPWDLY